MSVMFCLFFQIDVNDCLLIGIVVFRDTGTASKPAGQLVDV